MLKSNLSLKPFSVNLCWDAWIRTKINSSKGCCPTIRRHPNINTQLYSKLMPASRKGVFLVKYQIVLLFIDFIYNYTSFGNTIDNRREAPKAAIITPNDNRESKCR